MEHMNCAVMTLNIFNNVSFDACNTPKKKKKKPQQKKPQKTPVGLWFVVVSNPLPEIYYFGIFFKFGIKAQFKILAISLEQKPCFPGGETAAAVYIQERTQGGMLSKCPGNIKQELGKGLGFILSPVRKNRPDF